MIGDMLTAISAIIGWAVGLFRRDRQSDANKRPTNANQLSSDGSTQVVARDYSTVSVGPSR